MKILFASHTGVYTGGAEKSMLHLILHAMKNNKVIVNIPDGNQQYYKILKENKIKVSRVLKDKDKSKYVGFFQPNLFKKIIRRIIYVIKFCFFLNEKKPDVVYLNTIRTSSELIACKIMNVNTVMHLRGFDDKSNFRNFLLRFCDVVIVLNNYAKKIVNENGKKNNVIVIANGTPIKQLKTKKFDYKKLNFCTIGPYNYRKGTDHLYYFLKSLIQNKINFKYHHFGKVDPEDLFSENYLTKIKQLNFDYVEHGYLKNDSVISHLEKMHFMVLCSRKEGLSRAFLESIERGVIPILSKISEHEELIHDKGCIGLHFNEKMHCDVLFDAINKKQLEKISNKARENAVNKYDLKKINEDILNVLKNV